MSTVPSFLSHEESSFVLWCYTGGGHFFQEILEQIKKINSKSIPICFLFSNAGALVANRYGFFWELLDSEINKDILHFFINEEISNYNIAHMLQKGNFSFSIISNDPTFAIPIALANSKSNCIVVCPLTANMAAKLSIGISDCIISNLVSSGLKSSKKVGILPTDAVPGVIKTTLPIRQINTASISRINPEICKYNALTKTPNKQIQFLPQFCVGCKSCVKKFPDVFSFGDEVEIKIREIDSLNIKKLNAELTIFQKASDIFPFVRQHF